MNALACLTICCPRPALLGSWAALRTPRRSAAPVALAGLLGLALLLSGCADPGDTARPRLSPVPPPGLDANTATPWTIAPGERVPVFDPATPIPPAPVGPPPPVQPNPFAQRYAPDTILAAGQPIRIGTRVVLFSEPGGYNAYVTPRYFGPRVDRFYNGQADLPRDQALAVSAEGYTLPQLQQVVDRFVIHYDAAGTSQRCFDVLHERGLSAHFLLDLDGTLYQTLDLQERAWHASESNSRSIGVEIAHIGAFAPGQDGRAARWYQSDAQGRTRLTPPADAGLRRPAAATAPARPQPIVGSIHNTLYQQYDYTDAQYQALAKLTAALTRTFPKLPLQVPRDAGGQVLNTVMSEGQQRSMAGLVGHYHLTTDKIDPGPAFDWERLLRETRAALK